MIAVSIVILPSGFSVNKYKQVNFLGALVREITIPLAFSDNRTADSNLNTKVKDLIVTLQPENKAGPSLKKVKFFPKNSPKVREEKEIPDLLVLVSLPEKKFSERSEQLELKKNIKYLVSNDGRVIFANRLFTDADPEEDTFSMRRLWQMRFFPTNRVTLKEQ